MRKNPTGRVANPRKPASGVNGRIAPTSAQVRGVISMGRVVELFQLGAGVDLLDVQAEVAADLGGDAAVMHTAPS
jgi:hypothetical protein